MLASPTTRTWKMFSARADLNNELDTESFPEKVKKLVNPHPHLLLNTWAFGAEEGLFSNDYYVRLFFKSDLAEEQAQAEMYNAIVVASPHPIISWSVARIEDFTTMKSVVRGVAKDTSEVAATVGQGVGKVANVATGIGEAVPSAIANLHIIAIGAAIIAVVAGALYFAPIIMARK